MGTQETCLFRLDASPSRGSSEVFVLVIPKHGPRQGHELEVGGDLSNVSQDEVDLLLLPIEGLPDLRACGLQLTPWEQQCYGRSQLHCWGVEGDVHKLNMYDSVHCYYSFLKQPPRSQLST